MTTTERIAAIEDAIRMIEESDRIPPALAEACRLILLSDREALARKAER